MKTTTNVDDNIDQKDSGWTFDDSVAEEFDGHVRRSIPYYQDIQHATVKLTDWFLHGVEGERVYDLGCATGETIAQLADYHEAGIPTQFIGIDEQPAMLSKANDKIPETTNSRLVNRDLTVEPRFPDATVVISLFTLSFLTEADRQTVFNAIYRDLDRGGALIFCEKTRATSAFFQDIWTEHYWDEKAGRGLDADQILGKAKTLRGQLRPLTVAAYLEMLDTAGFDTDTDVDTYFKYLPWTGIIARKT